MERRIRNLVEKDTVFNVNLSHHSRTLARGLSQIRHFSIGTEKGRLLLEELFTKIGRVNQMSAYPLLKCFDDLEKFNEEMQTSMKLSLERMQGSIDKTEHESLFNQLNIMLKKV